MTMHVLRPKLIRQLQAADANRRFHVYYPHIEGLAPGTCVDVHSKVMIVDDEWLRVGSSNLSNRSMGLDSECDMTLAAHGDARKSAQVRAVRDRLLSEHLGSQPDAVARAIKHAGSISGGIATLGSEQRTRKPLQDLPEWSPTMVDAVGFADTEQT